MKSQHTLPIIYGDPSRSSPAFSDQYARASWGITRLSAKPLIRVLNDSVSFAPLLRAVGFARAIAPDAVRRRGPAGPASSELNHAAVFTADCRRARRPRQAAA